MEKKREINKELVIRALTDPKFREMLYREPQEPLRLREFTARNREEVARILEMVKGIESQIYTLADELLCAPGGPCGIA